MLSYLRKGATSWLAKILIGVLILSFAVWGVNGLMLNSTDTDIAKVGDIDITQADYQQLYPNVIKEWNERLKTKLTRQQIKTFGIADQVKYRLINKAVVENHARKLKLNISDEKIGEILKNSASLQEGGRFSKELLKQVLRNERISEAQFFNEQRDQSARSQITSVFSQKKFIPNILMQAMYHYREDKVEAEYFAIPDEASKKLKVPSETELKEFYDGAKTSYGAPEYRKTALYVLSLGELEKNTKISEDDIKASYEALKNNFITPETRTYDQLVFETMEQALEAHAALKKGDKLEDVATKFAKNKKSEAIGPVKKAAMLDPKLADALFALKKDEFTAPIEGKFAITIAKANEIKPRDEKTLKDVRPDIEKRLQQRAARKEIKTIYDRVEDLRASGMSVVELAKEMGGKALLLDQMDRKSAGLDGKPVKDLPATTKLTASIFDSSIGDDTVPVRHQDGGYVWFDVLEITPQRLKNYDEVKAKVKEQWLDKQQKNLASDFAAKLAKQIEDGLDFKKAAASVKAKIVQPKAFGRGANVDDMPVFFTNRLFGVKKGSITTGLDSKNQKWLIVRVKDHVVAKSEGEAFDAYQKTLSAELQAEMTDDLVTQYLDIAKRRFVVLENSQVFEQLKKGL